MSTTRKWSTADVANIRTMMTNGAAVEDIAEMYTVTPRHMRIMMRGHDIKFPVKKTEPMVVVKFACATCGKVCSKRTSIKSPLPKYCSHKCQTDQIKTRVMKDYTCLHCKNTFQRIASTNPASKQPRPIYCNRKCQMEFEKKSKEDAMKKEGYHE